MAITVLAAASAATAWPLEQITRLGSWCTTAGAAALCSAVAIPSAEDGNDGSDMSWVGDGRCNSIATCGGRSGAVLALAQHWLGLAACFEVLRGKKLRVQGGLGIGASHTCGAEHSCIASADQFVLCHDKYFATWCLQLAFYEPCATASAIA